jgi:hypothetical protein
MLFIWVNLDVGCLKIFNYGHDYSHYYQDKQIVRNSLAFMVPTMALPVQIDDVTDVA